ncbi:hypothetical protein GCM10027074_37410 [Streptomyces deserti]
MFTTEATGTVAPASVQAAMDLDVLLHRHAIPKKRHNVMIRTIAPISVFLTGAQVPEMPEVLEFGVASGPS